MLGNLRGRLALMVALSAGLGVSGGFVQPAPMAQDVSVRATRRTRFEGGPMLAPIRPRGYGGPGTTMAQQQRASRKARNVKRHRKSA